MIREVRKILILIMDRIENRVYVFLWYCYYRKRFINVVRFKGVLFYLSLIMEVILT